MMVHSASREERFEMISLFGLSLTGRSDFRDDEDIAWFHTINHTELKVPTYAGGDDLYNMLKNPFDTLLLNRGIAEKNPTLVLKKADSVTFVRGNPVKTTKDFNIRGITGTSVVDVTGPKSNKPPRLPDYWDRVEIEKPANIYAAGVRIHPSVNEGYAVLHYDIKIDNATIWYVYYAMLRNPGGAIRLMHKGDSDCVNISNENGNSPRRLPDGNYPIVFDNKIKIEVHKNHELQSVVRVVNPEFLKSKEMLIGKKLDIQPCIKFVGYYANGVFIVTGTLVTPYNETV
jgi:hypothetical protein